MPLDESWKNKTRECFVCHIFTLWQTKLPLVTKRPKQLICAAVGFVEVFLGYEDGGRSGEKEACDAAAYLGKVV